MTAFKCIGCSLLSIQNEALIAKYLMWKALSGALLFAVVVIAILWARSAEAFPENFRHGYPSCSSCHLAPGGGGVLNNYGRSVANTALTTFKAYRPDYPDWGTASYNARKVYVKSYSEFRDLYKTVDMEAEAELAVTPLPGLTFDGSAGVYGNGHERQYRKGYVALAFPYSQIRLGRFAPSAGINTPDHTDWARGAWGLGQGSEAYALEGAVLTPFGELIASHGSGPALALEATADEGYQVKVPAELQETYARTSAYLPWWRSQLGASGRWTGGRLDVVGIHGEAAPLTWLYALGEAGYTVNSQVFEFFSSAKLSVEPIQGVQLFGTHESKMKSNSSTDGISGNFHDNTSRIGIGVQLLPVYGLDVIGRCSRTYAAIGVDECAAVIHIYL